MPLCTHTLEIALSVFWEDLGVGPGGVGTHRASLGKPKPSELKTMQILKKSKIWCMVTNSVGSIALRQIKLQTCQAQILKPNYPGYAISSRELIPIKQLKAENEQRCPDHTFLWMRRWGQYCPDRYYYPAVQFLALRLIPLRLYRDLLYEEFLFGLSYTAAALRVITLRA